MPTSTRITHLIVRLDTGGAEKSLYRLVRGTAGELDHHIICFGPRSQIGLDIAALGVTIYWLDYRKQGPLVLWQALRILRNNPPHVLQGWMYFGNLIASVLALGLPGRTKVAWNIRQSPTEFGRETRRIRWSIAIARWSLLVPDLVIYNSFAGQQAHQQFGFNHGVNTVIPNGIDIEEFKPDPAAKAQWRAAYNVGTQTWVGMVCRFHPLKGVGEYLQAMRQLLDLGGMKLRFLLAGPGMDRNNPALMAMVDDCQISTDEIDFLGPVDDPAQFLPALDLLVIASVREGTPNILLEAMACGVKTVATRVGDVDRILREPARVVVPGDAADLAQKIQQALTACDDAAEQQRMVAEREFIQSRYQSEQCMTAYLATYQELLRSSR